MSANTNADVAAMVDGLGEAAAKATYDDKAQWVRHLGGLAVPWDQLGQENQATQIEAARRFMERSGLPALLQSQQAEITRLSAMVEEKDAALKRIASGKYMLATTVADIARQAISTQEPTP